MKKDYSNLTPIGERFVMKRVDPKAKHGSIHVPDEYQQRAPEGHVVALGTGVPDNRPENWEIEPGDHVLMKLYGGTDLGNGWHLCSLDDVLGVLVEGGNEIVPVGDNIIVRMMPPEKMGGAQSTIHLPDGSKQTANFGVVVGVAEDCHLIADGDFVFVASTQGAHYTVGGNDFIIISETKIKAQVEKPTA